MSIINGWLERQRQVFQDRRADLFITLMKPQPGMRILDLGGNRGQFAKRLLSRIELDITVADILDFTTECAEAGFPFVKLPESGTLPIENGAFDIVLCNSVIEHATLPKQKCRDPGINDRTWSRQALASQKAFAAEIRRVGLGYFVQTPHRHFPIDLHLWLPLTNWLPHSWLRRIVPVTDRFWIKYCGIADWRLLDPSEMQSCFPDGTIWIEHFASLSKSIISYKTPK